MVIRNTTSDYTLQCDDNQNCTISCDNYNNSCRNANIKCPTTGNCDITCNSGVSIANWSSHEVCKGINITCPINGNCNIECHETDACQLATIDARYATSFSLVCGSSATNTCTSLTIYFPPNINGNKKAKIEAADESFSAGMGDPLQFYAIHGWNDIDIRYGGNWDYHEGIMHCKSDYSSSCTFKPDAWTCADPDDFCNDPPTLSPTEAPSTLSHTIIPSETPRNNLSIQPTENPSASPINTPSLSHTSIPSVMPTKNPSVSPSQTASNLLC